jgi:hypothetical protein
MRVPGVLPAQLRISISIALAACLAASLAGCGSSDKSTRPGPSQSQAAQDGTPMSSPQNSGSSSSDPDVAAARAVIDAVDLGDPASLSRLDSIRFTDAGAAAAANAIEAGVSGDALWAATLVYGTAGTDPAVLQPLLANDDPTIRALAAASVLSLGGADAANVLADLILEDGNLRGSLPPLAVSEFAVSTLDRYIDGPGVADGAAPPDLAATWKAWLATHGATMQLDPATGRWGVR